MGYYDPPRLPDWALPPNEQKQGKNKETTSTTDNNNKKEKLIRRLEITISIGILILFPSQNL